MTTCGFRDDIKLQCAGHSPATRVGYAPFVNQEYSSGELMAAILDLRDFTVSGFATLEDRLNRKIDSQMGSLRHDMNKRFDSVDLRFDAFEQRLAVLE